MEYFCAIQIIHLFCNFLRSIHAKALYFYMQFFTFFSFYILQVSARCLVTAVHGAVHNVEINMKDLQDQTYITAKKSQCQEAIKIAEEGCKKVLDALHKRDAWMIVGLLRRDYLLSRLTHYFCIFYNQQEQYRKKLTWLQAVCRMKSCNINGFQMGILLAMNRRSVVANWQSILFQNKGFVFWSQLQR